MHLSPLVRTAARALVVCTLVALAAIARGQGQPQRFAGDVVAAGRDHLELRVGAENVKLRLPDDARITARADAGWSAVTTGSFVGTTAVPQADGTLLAKEVHVFTEDQRGTGEGHRPMSTPGDTMTNATVSAVSAPRPRDTVTNATVTGSAAGTAGARSTRSPRFAADFAPVVLIGSSPLMLLAAPSFEAKSVAS